MSSLSLAAIAAIFTLWLVETMTARPAADTRRSRQDNDQAT
jgi:hypothetical protein